MHFLSFLFDLLSWIAISLYFNFLITHVERIRRGKRIQVILELMGIGIFSGLFATLSYGLPDVGFAVNVFVVVTASIAAYSIVRFKKFRIYIDKLDATFIQFRTI